MDNPFEQYLDKITDEERRKALAEILKQEEDFVKAAGEGFMLRQDYSRKQDELAKERRQFEELNQQNTKKLNLAQEWQEWLDEHWDHEAGMTKREVQLREELERARAAGSGGDGGDYGDFGDGDGDGDNRMTKDQITKILRDQGVVTKADLAQFIDANKMKTGINEFALQAESFIADFEQFADKHRDEFNEPLARKDFLEFHKQSRLPMELAYDKFVAEKRQEAQEKQRKEQEAEIEKKIQAARADGEKAGREKAFSERMPVDVGDGAPPMGALQSMLGRSADEDKEIRSKRLGSHVISREAARELRERQASNA